MRRRLLTIAIFLLAGAVVNVAVAWGCGVLVTDYNTLRVQTVEFDNQEAFLHFTAFGSELVRQGPTSLGRWEDIGTPAQAIGPSHRGWGVLRKGRSGSFGMGVEEAQGWPTRSLRWYLLVGGSLRGGIDLGGERSYSIDEEGRSALISIYQVGNRTIAFIPIWSGFAINTLFYAAILWLVIPGPFALRRLIRQRRGLCLACGYDLRHGEHEACPECGVTV